MRALSRELDSLKTIAHDWAAWDDTYAFIADANDDYVKSNLVDETFADIRLNLISFMDTSGKPVLVKAFDLKNDEQMPVPRTVEDQLSGNSPLLRHTSTDSSLSGIIVNPEGPMLIVSEPIVTSEEGGPIRGTLIMARHLDASGIKHLAQTTQLSLSMYQFDDPQIPSDVQVARSSLSDQTPIVLCPLSAESIAGYALLKDIYGRSVFVLKVDMPREVYQKGQACISFFILSFGVVGLVFGVVIILLLEKQVLSRVTRLGKTVSAIGSSSDLSTRVSITGKDELSGLANEVNRMLEALQQSEASLRRAHDDLEKRVQERTTELVEANKQLMREIEERKRAEEKLLVYHEKLRSLASELSLAEERQRRRVAMEVHDSISQNLAFVKMKLGTFRVSTASSPLAESMDEMLDLVDETIQNTRALISELGSPVLYELGFVPAVEWLTQQAQHQHGIALAFEDDGRPKPLSDDICVLLFQAVRELLFNIAKHAQACTAKVLITRDDNRVRVEVEDDGVGFDSADIGPSLDTTDRFGLFSIRVRLEPLGGHIQVDSKPGHGTRVTLVAPLKQNGENDEEKI